MNVLKRMGIGSKLTLMLLVMTTTSAVQAADFTVNLVDGDGAAVSGFRWVLQEDTTYAVDPTNPGAITGQLGLNFHKSHHPIALNSAGQALKGYTDAATVTVADVPPGRYYLSVLPYADHAMGGAPVVVSNAATAQVTVTAEAHPIPTAQIAVYLFQDCFPLNGAPDLPEEEAGGSCTIPIDFTQFRVVVEEPGGKYGANGGPLLQNAFGDPLGTSYVQTCDADGANPGSGSHGCLDTDGAPIVDVMGDGTLTPNPDGTLLVKNLAPGKYGIIVTPPTGQGWTQTSTIEGTVVNDAWVKANEPPFFVEFGPPGPHVFMGFTKQHNDFTGTGTGATVSGLVTDMHMSRPVDTRLYSGRPFPQCWVAINENVGGLPGANRYAMPCNADSTFSIPNVPAGSYELKVFDTPLDVVIATYTFTVDPSGTCNGGQSCALGDVPVFNWFNRLTTYLFSDTNQNGLWDTGEPNIGAESGPVNIRWRDGTVYQSFPTDFDGVAPFDEHFPWFNWMVAEVGFTNKKATGATIVVDAGGPVNNDASIFTGFQEPPGVGEMTPQAQSENGGLPWRTETGPVLTQAFQGFLGQTNIIQFGKIDYLVSDFSQGFPPKYVGENGGISGIVFNTVTRAENNPQFAVGEGWEPGVPRVQVNLYADGDIDSPVFTIPQQPAFPAGIGDVDWNGDGIYQADDNEIDDINGVAGIQLSDVDNYPLGWGTGGVKGPEDVDRNGDGIFDLGDAIAVTWTDSWDDNTPTNCQGSNGMTTQGVADNRCFDGMRNWNQVRPGVFDGGYAFADYDHTHLQSVNPGAETAVQNFYTYVNSSVDPTVAATLQLGLLPSDYIVEATTPPGYEALREHHKNVDLGDAYIPSPQALPVACVGESLEVPPYFALSTKDGSGQADMLIPGVNTADVAAPFAGELRNVCDRKKVPLNAAQNAAADFFLVSEVPVAANVTGIILNDLANEFNPNSPNFGEKYAPPLVPVGFYDWNGKQVNRVYSDEYGAYNAMLPSTWNANLPMPSGMSPNMVIACMNDAGPIPDPLNPGQMIVDPFFNPSFSQFCYNFQFMPGSTTYLDTPVLATAAFTNPVSFPVDCAVPQRTPMIRSVENTDRNIGPFAVAGDKIVITSMGNEQVINPEWDGINPATRFITRNRNFGGNPGPGKLELVDAAGNRTDITPSNTNWSPTSITATVPSLPLGEYQVVVTRGIGVPTPVESEIGVTLTIGVETMGGELLGLRLNGGTYAVINVAKDASGDFNTIQEAIDAADSGDLILVAPGVYDELVIMHKPVKLQGWGAGAVTINARQFPTEKILAWRTKIDELLDGNPANGEISLLPGQNVNAGNIFQAFGAPAFPTEEGAGIFVAGIANTTPNNAGGLNRFNILRNRGARIDGFSVVGASEGGGIVVNGYAQFLNIGNNYLSTNSGFFGGGIRVGHPELTVEDADGGLTYSDAVNDRIRIHHNQVIKNGLIGESTSAGGGGISLYTGADNYRVEENWVCGNFSSSQGGGIAHIGRSNGGRIEHNDILFNESFSQAFTVNGGGLYVGGQAALQPTNGLLLSEGAGNVVINANRINGNLAGTGDGGGIAIVSANGLDVADNLNANNRWYDISVFNNMITNNVTGLAGAISVQDSLEVHVQNNTVAHNDSTATAAQAFTAGFFNQSFAQPAGIVSRFHTPDMETLLTGATIPTNGGAGRLNEYLTFSDANLNNNIIFGNRSFYWLNFDDPNTVIVETGLFPSDCTTPPGCTIDPIAASDDLAVLDGTVDSGEIMFARFNLLTGNADNQAEYTHPSNVFTLDPMFINPVYNEGKDSLDVPEFTVLQTAGAFDEGGNFLQVAFGPLTTVELGSGPNQRVFYDYHIGSLSPAVGAGQNVGGLLTLDFDGDPRGNGNTNEIGADELP